MCSIPLGEKTCSESSRKANVNKYLTIHVLRGSKLFAHCTLFVCKVSSLYSSHLNKVLLVPEGLWHSLCHSELLVQDCVVNGFTVTETFWCMKCVFRTINMFGLTINMFGR